MTLTYDEIIEAMAEAMWERQGHSTPWDELGFVAQEDWRADARAALSALRTLAEERGYRLMVPCEATQVQATIGTREYVGADRYARDHEYCDAQIAPRVVSTYAAMLSAAPDPTKEP